MAQEIEIEFKNILTREEFIKIKSFLPFPSEGIIQTNYYFETPNFSLKKYRAALRIREKNGKYQLTLKEPHHVGLLETHDKLTEKEALAWLNGEPAGKTNIEKQLGKMNLSAEQLVYHGKLMTSRWEYHDRHLTYVLDKSDYHGQSDYELEIEAPSYDEGWQAFKNLLQRLSIPERNTPNKIERFFSTMDKNKPVD